MEQPKISILTLLTKEIRSDINRTIKSVQDQDYKNFEHVILYEKDILVNPYKKKEYQNIKFFEINLSTETLLQACLKHSSGNIIVLLEPFDYFNPNIFTFIIQNFEAKYDVVLGDFLIENDTETLKTKISTTLCFKELIRYWEKNTTKINSLSFFFRKDILSEMPLDSDTFYDLLIESSLKTKIKKIDVIFGVQSFKYNISNILQSKNICFDDTNTFCKYDFIAKENLNEKEFTNYLKLREIGYQQRRKHILKKSIDSNEIENLLSENKVYLFPTTDYCYQYTSDETFSRVIPHTEIVCPGDKIINVLQVGKVASTSVVKSLMKKCYDADYICPVYHTHIINKDFFPNIFDNYNSSLNHYSYCFSRAFSKYNEHFQWYFIAIIRDPIEVALSHFFHHLIEDENINSNTLSIKRIKDNIIKQVDNYILKYFDYQYEKSNIINVFSFPFNKERGWVIMQKENIHVLILTFEKINEVFSDSIEEFIGIPNLCLEKENITSDNAPHLSDVYKQVKNSIKFEKNYLDRIFTHPYITHFYNEKEIETMYSKWLSKMNFTIAICTYQRFDLLTTCLDALAKQTLSLDDIEIIIVDNSLQPEISSEFRDNIKGIPNLHYYITEKSGLSYARNFAIEKCQTEYIAFIDDDSIVHADWLSNLRTILNSPKTKTGAIGGKVLPIWQSERPQWLGDKMLNALTILDWGNKEFEITDFNNYWLVGANIAYNTVAVKQVGGFSEHLGRDQGSLLCHEELDLNLRLHQAGFTIIYNPNIVVSHSVNPNRLSKDHFSELMFSEGISRAFLRKTDAEIESDLHFFEEFLIPKNNTSNHLFTDVNIPELFANKMHAISRLGRLIAQAKKVIEREKRTNAISNPDHLTINSILPAVIGRKCSFSNEIWIVLICFNAEKTIIETLKSISDQKGNYVLHLHIQDGGSTDSTLNIIKQWSENLTDRESTKIHMAISSEKNNNLFDAINKGFQQLNVPDEDFMTWLNTDTILQPETFQSILRISKDLPTAHWICGNHSTISDNGYLFSESVSYENTRYHLMHGLCDSRHNPFFHQEGSFWRGWIWNMVGGINCSLKLAGDYDLWIRFSKVAELFPINKVLASSKVQHNILSRDLWRYIDEIEKIVPRTERERWEKNLFDLLSEGYPLFVPSIEFEGEKATILWNIFQNSTPSKTASKVGISLDAEKYISSFEEYQSVYMKQRLTEMGVNATEELFKNLTNKEILSLYYILSMGSASHENNQKLIVKLDEILYQKSIDLVSNLNEIDLLNELLKRKEEILIEQGDTILEIGNELEELRKKNENLTNLVKESLTQIISLSEKVSSKEEIIVNYERTIKEIEILKELNETLLLDNAYYKKKFEEINPIKESIIRNKVLIALLQEKTQ